MITKTCTTIEVKIFISGPIEEGKQVIRKVCMDKGLCVTIEPTTYIYTGGEELGYVVTVRNYPRFPSTEEELVLRASNLAHDLLNGTFQHSVMIVAGNGTHWISKREENK